MIDGQQYQLDSSCSVVIEEVGDISCDAVQPVSTTVTANLLYGGGVALLLLLMITGTVITVCVIKWKMSRKSTCNVR